MSKIDQKNKKVRKNKMIWLQEYGTKTGANRPDYKLFYCENDSDVAYAPTLTEKGNANYYVNKTDSAALDEVKVGDQILIWGTGDLKTMMPANRWKSSGEA